MKAEVLTVFYDEMFNSARLNSILVGPPTPSTITTVQIYLRMAPPNPVFPYLVYDMKEQGTPDEVYALYDGTFTVSVNDYASNNFRALSAAEAIKGLFENGYVPEVFNAEGRVVASNVRLWYQRKVPIPTGREDHWREDVIFTIRLYDEETAETVLNRPTLT